MGTMLMNVVESTDNIFKISLNNIFLELDFRNFLKVLLAFLKE